MDDFYFRNNFFSRSSRAIWLIPLIKKFSTLAIEEPGETLLSLESVLSQLAWDNAKSEFIVNHTEKDINSYGEG